MHSWVRKLLINKINQTQMKNRINSAFIVGFFVVFSSGLMGQGLTDSLIFMSENAGFGKKIIVEDGMLMSISNVPFSENGLSRFEENKVVYYANYRSSDVNGWYYLVAPNGYLQFAGIYLNSLQDGIQIVFYIDEKMSIENLGYYKKGEKVGIHKSFQQSNFLLLEMDYDNLIRTTYSKDGLKTKIIKI